MATVEIPSGTELTAEQLANQRLDDNYLVGLMTAGAVAVEQPTAVFVLPTPGVSVGAANRLASQNFGDPTQVAQVAVISRQVLEAIYQQQGLTAQPGEIDRVLVAAVEQVRTKKFNATIELGPDIGQNLKTASRLKSTPNFQVQLQVAVVPDQLAHIAHLLGYAQQAELARASGNALPPFQELNLATQYEGIAPLMRNMTAGPLNIVRPDSTAERGFTVIRSLSPDATDMDTQAQAAIDQIRRAELTPAEVAAAYLALMDQDLQDRSLQSSAPEVQSNGYENTKDQVLRDLELVLEQNPLALRHLAAWEIEQNRDANSQPLTTDRYFLEDTAITRINRLLGSESREEPLCKLEVAEISDDLLQYGAKENSSNPYLPLASVAKKLTAFALQQAGSPEGQEHPLLTLVIIRVAMATQHLLRQNGIAERAFAASYSPPGQEPTPAAGLPNAIAASASLVAAYGQYRDLVRNPQAVTLSEPRQGQDTAVQSAYDANLKSSTRNPESALGVTVLGQTLYHVLALDQAGAMVVLDNGKTTERFAQERAALAATPPAVAQPTVAPHTVAAPSQTPPTPQTPPLTTPAEEAQRTPEAQALAILNGFCQNPAGNSLQFTSLDPETMQKELSQRREGIPHLALINPLRQAMDVALAGLPPPAGQLERQTTLAFLAGVIHLHDLVGTNVTARRDFAASYAPKNTPLLEQVDQGMPAAVQASQNLVELWGQYRALCANPDPAATLGAPGVAVADPEDQLNYDEERGTSFSTQTSIPPLLRTAFHVVEPVERDGKPYLPVILEDGHNTERYAREAEAARQTAEAEQTAAVGQTAEAPQQTALRILNGFFSNEQGQGVQFTSLDPEQMRAAMSDAAARGIGDPIPELVPSLRESMQFVLMNKVIPRNTEERLASLALVKALVVLHDMVGKNEIARGDLNASYAPEGTTNQEKEKVGLPLAEADSLKLIIRYCMLENVANRADMRQMRIRSVDFITLADPARQQQYDAQVRGALEEGIVAIPLDVRTAFHIVAARTAEQDAAAPRVIFNDGRTTGRFAREDREKADLEREASRKADLERQPPRAGILGGAIRGEPGGIAAAPSAAPPSAEAATVGLNPLDFIGLPDPDGKKPGVIAGLTANGSLIMEAVDLRPLLREPPSPQVLETGVTQPLPAAAAQLQTAATLMMQRPNEMGPTASTAQGGGEVTAVTATEAAAAAQRAAQLEKIFKAARVEESPPDQVVHHDSAIMPAAATPSGGVQSPDHRATMQAAVQARQDALAAQVRADNADPTQETPVPEAVLPEHQPGVSQAIAAPQAKTPSAPANLPSIGDGFGEGMDLPQPARILTPPQGRSSMAPGSAPKVAPPTAALAPTATEPAPAKPRTREDLLAELDNDDPPIGFGPDGQLAPVDPRETKLLDTAAYWRDLLDPSATAPLTGRAQQQPTDVARPASGSTRDPSSPSTRTPRSRVDLTSAAGDVVAQERTRSASPSSGTPLPASHPAGRSPSNPPQRPLPLPGMMTGGGQTPGAGTTLAGPPPAIGSAEHQQAVTEASAARRQPPAAAGVQTLVTPGRVASSPGQAAVSAADPKATVRHAIDEVTKLVRPDKLAAQLERDRESKGRGR